MILRHSGVFPPGYTPLAALDSMMGMEFGILRLSAGREHADQGDTERAFLLLQGAATFSWEGSTAEVTRSSMLESPPAALHVPSGVEVRVRSRFDDTELALLRTVNTTGFPSALYRPAEVEVAKLSPPRLDGAADREIRTVVDDTRAPRASMTFGEIVNPPGRWSSYPPHHHPQPELYHFRFFPRGGFGYSEQGDEVFKVRNGDTALIPPGLSHPQCAAPGYAMVYVWAIRHLEGDRFRGDSRIYLPEHEWTNS